MLALKKKPKSAKKSKPAKLAKPAAKAAVKRVYFFGNGKGEGRGDMKELLGGKGFGDPTNPLLVSCRSGAKDSMPGMMDTVLNIGLNDAVVEGMAQLTNN